MGAFARESFILRVNKIRVGESHIRSCVCGHGTLRRLAYRVPRRRTCKPETGRVTVGIRAKDGCYESDD